MPGFMQAKQIVYQSEREVRRALTQVSLYVCFLIATTIIALSTQHVFVFYFNQAMENTFLKHSEDVAENKIHVPFAQIVTIEEWWNFVKFDFLVNLNLAYVEKEVDKSKEDDKDAEDEDDEDDDKDADKDKKDQVEESKEDDKDAEKDDNEDKLDDKDADKDKEKEKDKKKDQEKEKSQKEKPKLRRRKKRQFVPIEVDRKERNSKVAEGIRSVIILDNYVLGVPKLRQIRVSEHSCHVHTHFEPFFDTCYSEYKFSKEDRQQYYKRTRYYNRDEYRATPVFGNLLKYDGPGYMVFLGFDDAENHKTVQKLIDDNWIDVATRIVILEFVVYNANTHLFNNIKIMAEVLPTGGVLPKWSFDVVPLYTIWSPRNFKTLISAVVFYLLVVYYTSVEIQELLKDGFKEYFGNAQNYIDITILLTAYIALTLSMTHPFNLDGFIGRMAKNPKSLASLDESCFWFSSYTYVMAICVFMVWAKVFRFVGFNKTLLQFSTTLRRCFYDILGFALMFLFVFIAFAVFGNMVFGSANQDFSTFQGAIFAMVRMVLGDFPYERIEKANRILGPTFCIIYVILITFIALNMFLAIINETYSSVKEEIKEDHSALKVFVINLMDRFKNCLKRCMRPGRDSDKKEETPTSSFFRQTNQQDDTRSMYEYADVPLSSLGKSPRRRLLSRSKPHEDEEDQFEDELTQDITNLNERIELLEETIGRMRANMNRLFGRVARKS